MKIKFIVMMFAIALFSLASCSNDCEHAYGELTYVIEPTCTSKGAAEQICTLCGDKNVLYIDALEHIPEITSAVPATCTSEGLTEGSHCQMCNAAITPQEATDKLPHTPIIDEATSATCTAEGLTEGSHCQICGLIITAQTSTTILEHTAVIDDAVPATCTAEGLTEGSHCDICGTVLKERQTIPKSGHDFSQERITKAATCLEQGLKEIYCSVCGESYTESYNLPKYTADEIKEAAIKYVGEITTYDKNKKAVSLGTCFLISASGQLITNYHVIEGAYSARVALGDKSYEVKQVLAYDKDIDLAVLKIDATEMPFATICKIPILSGGKVYAIGSAKGIKNTFTEGNVTHHNRVIDNVKYVEHNADITYGNSGGPLINEFGEVIAVNTQMISESQNRNLAVFVSELEELNYSVPITMSEFYDKEFGPYAAVLGWLLDNPTASNGNSTVFIHTDETIAHSIAYDSESESLVITYSEYTHGEGYLHTSILLNDSYSVYDYVCSSTNTLGATNNLIRGQINTANYTRSSNLTYSYIQGGAKLTNALTRQYQTNLVNSVSWFEWFLENANLNLTLKDFGFKSFK